MTQNVSNIQKLKAYIDHRNLTYSGMAEMIGIGPSKIFQYVRGTVEIPGPVMFIVNNDMDSCESFRNGLK